MGSLWSWWLLWAGATLLWGLTQEASVGPRTTEGEEFLTAFLQNYLPWYSSASLHLLITSLSDSPASVSILSQRDNTSQKVTVKPGQSVLVNISSKAEMTGSNIFQRAVVVHSDHNISVQAVNSKPGTAEVTVLRPVRTLGTTYFVLTPSGASITNLKEFAVVAGAAGALVSIQLKGVVTFQGKVYPQGSVLNVTLEPFAVAQLQSTYDLSGSKVTASSPVAVLSGHSCVRKHTNCDHVVEQLLPTSSWGTRYVVPPLASQAHYDLAYVVASQATKLTYNHGGTTGSRGLQSGDVVEFEVWSSHPLYLSADVGIQVLLFGTGGMRDMMTYDPYLVVIPDVAAYCPAYVVGSLSGLQNLAVVVAPTKAVEGLTVNGQALGTQATWTAVPGSEFSYAEVDLGTAAKTYTAEAATDFGLLTFGLAETVGYGTVPACGRTLLSPEEPSCEDIKCEPGQHCQVVDGKAKCVKEPTATCRAQGDPHYTTFDGRRYDMMGTCMYTLAELCGTDESLPAFSVEAKNEHRGNQRVSYVGFVTVRAYSHAVSLARGEYGFVRIDNQRSCLPVSLSDGRLRVYQSGMRAVVELDFGLVVNYNWDSQLTLSLPMRFRDQVCGLCGNYDGDPSNDFLTPDRVQVADAMEFGKSWKLDDGDYLCQDGCQSNCPKCTQGQAQQYKGDHLCGMLTLSDGPFATCHASLDPQPFLEECVYDLCVVGGDRPSLCRGLLAYAEACLELGISVGDWRSPANCRPPCPANSRYELCGPACQASCNGAAAPANCSARPCVEGCVCLSGFVASGDACVPASDCGCTFEGRQLAPGQAVWADDQCRRRCTCDGATQQVRCSDTQGCPAGERCRVQDGLLGCYPDRFGTCEGSGDPHYVSFDGRRFDFMGTCTYLLAGSCGQNAALPDFRVLVENEHRGSQTVSYTRAVRVEARGVELAVRREHPGKVLLDGVLRCLPFQAADGQIQVFRQGSDAIIRTDFGLTVTFNWNSRVRAKVPGSYAEALCGLCGNFNGDPGDDLAVRGGGQAANALAFGNSWLEEKRPGCGPVEPGKCPNLDALVTQQVQSKKECGILADPQGPFRECHSTVDPQGAVRDCIYDRCLLPGQSGPLCDALAAYAAACQAAGATVDSWRSETFCPPPCPAHSHYEAHSHGCPLSCGDIPVPGGCGSDFFESCVCDEGFVLSGESCVPLASCGCVHQGIYHPPGQSFYPGPGCESLCHCQEGGLVSCEPSSCGPHEACKPSAGILGCVPVGSATCQASGDPHYTTFDGRRFDFMGTCVYVLAQTCGAQAGLEQFTILQENAAWGNGKVSVTRVVTVQVANLTLRLEQNRWTVKVDGVDLKLPVELAQGRVWAFRHGSDAVIETDFGLRVAYDLKYYARVTIPGNYHGQLCGLCGNYNGDPKDDFQKPNGSQAGNSNEFGDSWEKPVPGSPCGPVCPGDKCEVLKCAPELEEKYKQEKSCGLLASTTGPLAACHKLVDPQGPLEDCVFDLCLGGGNASILCSNIHAYVSACQAAGGQVKPWRNESFCPMPCPPHSHYEICADTCSLGCSALSAPSLCPDRCAEGCQCDSGYLSDGQGCVPIQDCGCYHSGIYFDPNKTVLIDNCQKQCVCHAGEGLVCQNHSCEAQQVCQPVDGVLSCKNKEPSCEDIKCEPGQHCQVVDGKAKCVKEPTATCRAQGDPHYTTFDGRRYDMMGTCTYTLAELCGTDESLPAFSVEAKNEHRGNQRVSYVGFVTVRAYSHAVSLARGEYGFVRIDNQRSCLPVSLSDGRLRVYQSGMRAVVELDFGLVVNYNWDSQLTLSLPMRFRDQVCGLCGNYDGDPSNDFLTPDRVQVADAMEFGKSWKLDDGDYLCQDGCQSNCPKCTQGQAQQYKGDHLCGMLTLSDGPFATCHASLDPQPFLEECVYDLCVVGGDRPSLCRGLLAYAEACLELGISVGDWRSPANCRPPCPANSRYELCGPACQASCNGAAAPANCSARPCVEGCVCLSGFVASGDACVPASDCGCTFEGRQLAPGQAVWADDQCRRRCTCDGATQQVRCSDTQGCPAGERCRVQDGLLGCYPDRFGTCEGSGDPHYVSFDGRRFDFMGTCTYLLAGSCGQNAALPDFRVLVENEHRGSQTVSYTRAVRVEARGVELAVRREHPGKVLLDGVLRCLPFQAADGQIQVFRQGSDAIIRTDFGLTVTFNWNSRVRAKVPGSYAEALCGLCGNFNGDPGDDLAVRGGGQAANALAFGNSWLEEKRPGCGPVEPGKCPNLDALVTQQVQSKKECGILADPQGPFRECHSTVDPQGAVRDCIYDRCLLPGQSGPLCDALAAYAAACQAAGATVDSWRSETFCPPPCPAHSHYEAHSHGCPLSCGDIPVPGGCGSDFFESCVCDEGFVLSGESCVPLASCGCVHQGIYHPPGQSFYPGPGCESLCHCQEGGLVSCEPSSCGPHEACKPSAGILGCVPVGSATCQASGDPHYTTFDGRRFDFMGTCVYVLAQTCGAQAGLEQFTILQENAAWGNGKVSVTRVVTVQVANLTLRLEQNRWTVKVDGVDLKLPVELAQGRVWAFRHGSDAVIETDFGLRVAYDLKYYARVTIPGNYHGQLCGLCGNYNGDPKDDFQKPNGSQAGNSNEFGDSWEKPVPGSPCGPVCPGDKCEVLKCAPELEEKYKQEKSCGLLASTTGPLAACHKLVDPQGPLEDCVFDLCLGGGNASILCSNIHAYVSACQAAGGQVKPWRNESFCPMPCPPHSHYEICADTCSLGCSALSAPSLCPDRCAEGCQCDSGYLSDGQGCVPIQDCGCYHSGIYFDPNKTVLIDNCQKQCVCHAGEGLVCQNHSCEAQQVCQPVDGVLSCKNKEPSCEDIKCEPGQHCQVVDGKAKCVKEPTATCRAQGDPHYTTFDGRRYDMMGTCTYTLAELCGTDESLPAFSVEAKNEHRGNQRVSYVGFVTVRAYSHAVSLARGEYGFVRIDNQRSCLPVSLSDGRLRVYQSGMRAVVELDFGLVVNYNWDSQLTLSLPMRFRDQVCGLCGNYDGDPSNDFLTPDRVQVADAMEFGKSWKLDDGDYLCQDGCQSNCPKCTQGQAQQYKGDHLCGMLTLSDGPFATCHASLDPQPFLEECVYDLCVVGGDRPSLCRGLLAYAEACLELGISVGDWRSPANCRPPCPANSRYELCGPACQASCNGAAAPANCSARPCVEGCVCLSGFVASGDACVPASDCGCTFEGRQLAPGQAVWADDQCRRRCTCDGATQQVRCSDTQGCPAGERCRVQDGLLGCYPDRFGTCEGSGDPHYVSFDGRRFDFMGTCTYLLAGSCGQNAALPDFRVLVENEHRGSQTVSYTRAVRVEARGVELAVRREHPGKVLLDGVLRCLPFQAADGQIQVFRQGSDAIIRTDFGLTVTFNWNSRVRAKVPGSYAEALCGLCGNFNGDPGDDLAVRGGGQAANALAFGNSWLEEKRPGCGPVEPGKCPNLDALVTQQVQSKKECGILADPQGPFRECHSTVDPQGAVRDCVYDRCLLPGQSGPLCDALAAYAAACQAAGATVDSWRSETFCPPPCPAHSHYEAHSHGCPLSCGDIPVPGGCGSDFFESCVCDEGFVLSGESCVPLASCGCVHQGIYHPPGQTFHPGPGCESLCHCQEGGLVSCEPSSCGPHEACKPSAGILGCVPVGSATCQTSGDPHYTTFDGRRFSFMGTCVYVLAQTCGAQAGLEQFTILHENAAWGNGKVSVTRVVTVQVANFTLRLEQNRWTVTVDGVDLNLPVELAQGRVRAFRHGSDAVIETDFGLRVAYDLNYYARVTIPGNYHGQLCGLCGNYNGDPKDDFQKPNGSQAGNSNEFGDSWEKPVPGSPCAPVCPGDKCEELKCAPELEEKYKQEKSCGLLASTTGPLAACHKLVDPQGPLEDCVFDLCLGGGNASILCSNIHAYVSACQAAGGQVKPWRNETFCPMPCPPHSHYEICADTCSLGCSALSAPSLCPDRCAEGCQCDSGYLSDGQGCVPIQDCGCYHSGIYFDPNKTVLIDNCQKQCVCHAGEGEGLVCQNHSCEAHQVCQPVDGVLSCVNKEPSCEDIKCEPGQHCQVVDGKAKCVKEPTATCRAQGDPHYTTFDGRRYDMMGTCMYTLAELCGTDESLPAFSVEAKNEHRGNQRVSYVGFVTVRAYSHAVSLARGEYGFVRIDNQRSCLPVSLSDGRLRVYQSGMRAVVELDFGLVVNYNWDSQLTLSLPMRFRDQVCGLCGNYDGDPSNDFLTPDRVQVADAMEFGKSWKLDDGDYLCQDGCQSNCPKCTQGQAQQYKGDHLCGMLTLSDGPFATCHASLDPQPFLEECVYDLCVVGGDRPSLCRGLLAYAEACLELGISVGDWRSPANCRPPCPANSRYELCGPACQASCNGAAAPANCSARPCVEGCVCLSGFVASGDACVPASDCGCTFEGRQLAPGQAVWADDQCRRRCTCDGATQQVRCSDTQGCPAGERCRVQDGLLGCYPDRFGTCEGSGDPHYVSFDGRRFDFMGTCTYLLAGSCGQNAALPDFRVLVENEHRGSQTVSYTRAVRVEARGVELAVRREHPGKVLLDGVLRCLPFQAADGQIQVFRQGSDAIIRTDFGLTVTFNWNSRVRAKVPGSYAEALCGLCGNFNGDPGDDLAVRGGGQAANALAFGNSWLEEKRPGCGPVEPGKCPNLDALVTQQVQSKKECGILADPQGPFRECHSTVDPQGAVRDCIYDRCLLPGQSGPLCDALAAYAAACQAAGATVDSWRSETFCPPRCPAHSHYEAHSHGCPLSCGDIPVPGGCGLDFFESCVCDEGFVLSGESCVPLASCGCVHQGIYHPPGQSFYPGPGCESLCHCQEGGLVSCKPSSCGPHEACKPSAGILGCVPVGSATCQASGDPHYTTFDGRRFDFMGTCVYVLAQTCGAHAGLEQFTVLQENAAWGNGKVSVTRVVTVQVANFTLRLEQNRWTVKVDGVDLNLPVELAQGRVRAFRHGSDAVIETDFGLHVAYDLNYYARVTIPGNYHGQLCGLCGNYNGDPKDDFQKPNGSQAGNSNEFGDSWEKPVPGSPCGPGDGCDVPKCAPELEEKYKQEKSCGLLASTTGPLAACHKLVDPQGPLEDCVFDLCLGGGNASILCSNIHAYVSACQAAGGQVKPWRNESFCPMPCPPHSHYEICADTCSLGCSALSAPSLCPDRCAEGCQCDSGYLSDGQGCVPIQDCGCYHSGIYFDPNKTVLIDNCQKQCVCHAGEGEGLVCQNHSCEAHQVCQPVDGVLSCVNKDVCHGVTCRPQETCREQGGQGVCVPNYEVTCWLWGDPHYHSFDGRDFDFQGTCNYVLATTVCPGVNAEGLTPFTVTTKNENRGNPAVSYVRLVTVTALGTNISIHKGEIGKVRVNDVLTALPASVAGGRLAVAHSTSKAVLTADFGLRVAYDWNWRVEVTLPSSYHSTVCGLCGNMDGNSSNDHTFPNGTLAPSTAIWGGSWRAPGWDPLCWDECQGACPTCPENRLEEYGGPGFCGPLVPGTGGPFTACHAHVPPDSFFKGCVLDVCLGGGSKDILCQALAAYAASCQAARITIEDWREQAGCVIPCSDNSHYELCGPPCPASCPSPVPSTTPDPCSGPCVEGCQCDKGYVLSVDHCVPLDGGCGCWANGTYHEAGSEFWADGSCSRRCRCGPGGGSLICTPASCGQGEECVLLPSGQHGCHPISTAECQAWGDPHYVTLDGKRFDFQGTCEYLLSAPCQALPAGAENFTVTVANEHRGSQAVSYTRSVTLHIYNHSLTLSAQWPQRLQVDGKLVALPFQPDSSLRAYLSGADVVVTAANGLSLSFNRDSFVRLQVPAAYAGALCGLCGNYNRDPADDLKNEPAQWQVGGAAGCGECVPGPCPPPCTPEQQAPFGGPDACGVISATDGPLAPCHSLLPPEPYFQACLLDACQAQGHPGGLCPAVATYVAACQAAGAQLDEWRRPDFCPFQCPADSHYKLCGNSCPVSCPSLSAPEGCEPACREGCVCDAGFVLSGDTCVPVGQCGCLHEGHYYSLGEAFYPGPECERRCECGPGGQVRCQAGLACRPYEECRLENGVQACHPTGCGHCLSSGGVHYVTLDGRVYDLHGSCSYVLAQVCDSQLEDEDFSIVLEKDAAGVFQRLLVTVDNLVVSLAPRLQVSVDGETVTLPVAVGPVRVTAEGRNVVLQTAKGLRLLFDDNAHILMSIPSPFRGRLCGLCGNFNGNWSDDFVLPNGNAAPSVEAFGAAWRAPSSSVGCSEGCGASGCPVCSAEQTAPYESTEACGRLRDPQGPFQACHAVLTPSEYFRQCVYDMCTHKGDSAVLCRSLAAYTAACQAAGVAVKPWRTDSFCPLQCPAHSHYSICTRSCQGSCAALSGLTGCTTRCFEGCECDDRFLLSHGVCVPIQDCGCTHDGRYLPVNSSLLTSDCSQRCSCSSSTGLTCQAAGCPEGRVCEVQAGTRDCWATRGLCSLSADGNLTSFDGAHLAVSSPGVYELSSLCPGRPETSPWYRVVTDVQPCAGKVEGLGQAHIFFWDGLVTVTPSQGVWVNGRRVDLPAEVLTCVFVSQTPDGSVLVRQKAGVQVLLGTNGQLTILVSNDHSGMLCGACGNFDGDRTNDGHDSQGKPALESWRAPDFSPCHS